MKPTCKHNAGFTLVELVVAIAMATIVTAAATSVLLMGLRINRQTSDTASQQMTVRALLNVMENAAADGKITDVKSDYASWTLIETVEDGGESKENSIFSYDANTQTISTNGTPVLTGVYASNAILEGNLLSISIETKEGIYTSSIYCRMLINSDEPSEDTLPGDTTNAATDGRSKFIEILKSQYRSRGTIWEKVQTNGEEYTYKDIGVYYSQWYCGGSYWSGWNEQTPWCACYISWAIYELEESTETSYLTSVPKESHVDKLMATFDTAHWLTSQYLGGNTNPRSGDLIFFDWNADSEPQHVGVVLEVKNGMVYTIEGNSAGRVTIRSYLLTDQRIIGYGILPWKN